MLGFSALSETPTASLPEEPAVSLKATPPNGVSFTELDLKATPGTPHNWAYKYAHSGEDFTELVTWGFQGIPYEFSAKSPAGATSTILPFIMHMG